MLILTKLKQLSTFGNNNRIPNSNNSNSTNSNYSSLPTTASKEDEISELSHIQPPTKRLRSLLSPILLLLILVLFLSFITYLLKPAALPRFTLRLLASVKGEEYHTFTTTSPFCKPLVENSNQQKRKDLNQGLNPKRLNGTQYLNREDWAYVITGEELMRSSEGDGRVSNNIGIVPLLHCSWKTHIIPERFREWSESWRALNSNVDGWKQVIWSDADNLALVSDYYPEWLELYLSLETPIHKADFSRNLYMHKFGGVYYDLDVIALLPTTITLNLTQSSPITPTAYLARMGRSKSFVHSLPNAYFASTEKSHPFWLLPIEFAHKAMLKSKALRGGPEWVTGPVGIYESEKVWRSLEKGGNLERGRWEVKVLDEGLIFPFAWSTSWDGPADIARCLCWGSSHFFDGKECRNLFPTAGALTFWTKSWASMIKE